MSPRTTRPQMQSTLTGLIKCSQIDISGDTIPLLKWCPHIQHEFYKATNTQMQSTVTGFYKCRQTNISEDTVPQLKLRLQCIQHRFY